MKKILSFALLLCTFSTALVAQDKEFRQELSNFINLGWATTANNNFDAETLTNIFMLQLNEMPNCPYTTEAQKAEAAARLAQQYYDERGKSDFIDVAMPFYQKHLTTDELKKLNKQLKTDTKLFNTGNKLADKSVMEQMVMTLMAQMMGSLQKIATGETPDPIITPQEKQDALYIAVVEYCNASGISSNTINALASNLAGMGQDEEQKKMMQAFMEFLSTELPSAYYKGCKGRITVDEVNYITDFYKSPMGQKLVACSTEILKDPMTLANSLMTKTKEWLDKQELK